MFQSRNLSLNMPKNALFLLKNCKNRRALGAPPPDPLASGGWGIRPQTPVTTPMTIFWLRSCKVLKFERFNILQIIFLDSLLRYS